ncbi:MAG TPA: 2-polyprenyl-3-methyl-6-methoxy-1,4-benzoquinone monooxygenase [Woeseiaceae bacterium]|nr:2-polyprenyl-3-methyl-6-methoxy-1,4-benzoquinone monooxygenase [Woeseiaceae bacterium]
MTGRRLTSIDRFLAGLDDALRTVAGPAPATPRRYPAEGVAEPELDLRAAVHAAGLMRVNHAGEVAAQGLYQGHAAVARDAALAEQMQAAADEELDHLAWCERRLGELGAARSRLSPLWYGGAFAVGAASGLFGDRWSLGFIAETERQVCDHLERHLDALPAADLRSRAIVRQMRDEEAGHGTDARNAGAAELPLPVKRLMRMTARVMTATAYRL